MLETKYGLKYSMPHSVVHIVDNSMYKGQLPLVVVDDPSLYATIVVSGAPMGLDREMVAINRSDVLNVAYGMSNISANDIKKYGQSITYPSALISQDVPVKFMRVTPDDATYAFSCLLIEWRWDASENKMHVRFKTTEDLGNDGLPAGMVLSSFKNPARLNAALVKGFASDNIDGGWTRRVFMTTISAGRGKEYNKYNYCVNQTQQSRRPANVRYTFATIDTSTDQTVERFYASLVNENNSSRTDYVETVNVQVAKRVKGSSILVPTINEAAVKELYSEYMDHFNDMLSAGIVPSDSAIEFAEVVYKTLNVNIFDPIYGRYVYNGDTDVLLPYFQVDMFNLDIPQLPVANQIKVFLDANTSIDSYINDPVDLQNVLIDKTKGVVNASSDNDYIHVGDVFLTNTTTLNIAMVTSINQYTGAVTTIPITRIYTQDTNTDSIRGYVAVETAESTVDIAAGVQDLIDRKRIIPRVDTVDPSTGDTTFKPEFVIVEIRDKAAQNPYNGLNSFILAQVPYNTRPGTTPSATPTVDDQNVVAYTSKTQIYNKLVYPSTTVSSFALCKPTDPATPGSWEPDEVNWYTPGATIVDIEGSIGEAGLVYVNKHGINNQVTDEVACRYAVNDPKPFVVGVYPKSIRTNDNVVGSSYDCIIYKNSSTSTVITWTIQGSFSTQLDTTIENTYLVGDKIKITCGDSDYNFKVDSVNGNTVTVSLDYPEGSTPPTSAVAIEIKDYDAEYTGGRVEPPVTPPTGLKIHVGADNIYTHVDSSVQPTYIKRFVVNGTIGTLFRYAADPTKIPSNYYSSSYGINPNSEMGGINVKNGYAGFFDDNISDIEFKWRYSELLVRAFRGKIDPRIQSPTRCPAKYLFDGGMNTIVGQTILPYMQYKPLDIINASTIFTDDEKEAILLDNSIISGITEFEDIDVKQAMYDLMEYRCYYGIPEDKRPVGPGSGLSLQLDSGITDANTALLINTSFSKRFSNPNAAWDIGGYTSAIDGISYTYTKRLVDNLFSHMKTYSVNKPFTGKYTSISPEDYTEFFPDLDTTDWELRELLYKSGGNAWMQDVNGNLQRKSQRTLYKEGGDTSDLIQENNMRTLSQLTYILQNKIDTYLLEYNDDGVLKTLKDEVDNLFTNWVGNLVQALDITFERDTNPQDGGEIVVCYCNVTFRGLILRVPIIVNVQRRTENE